MSTPKGMAIVFVACLAPLLGLTDGIPEGTPEPITASNNPHAEGGFSHQNVTLLSNLPISEFGGPGFAMDLWGWKDEENDRYYAIVTRTGGTSFIDVTSPYDPVYVGRVPSCTDGEPTPKDVKVYANHAYIVSEQPCHNLHVFDLTRLRGVHEPQDFQPDFVYTGKANSHNIVINEQTGFAYLVSGRDQTGCNLGLHVLDLADPKTPVMVACWGEDYIHDAQCTIYQGPDETYQGREICFANQQDPEVLAIIDVSNKSNIQLISTLSYPQSAYSHQGWLTEDQTYFIMGDEQDEATYGINTRTIVVNVSDLDSPLYVGDHIADTGSTDHNLYIKGNYVYQANYTAGLRILRMDNLAAAELTEVAFFDTYPLHDNFGETGAWSVYPFFDNGTLLVSDISNGLFALRANLAGEFQINNGINDAWFNPETAGQGFFITVFENIGMIFLAWFTFDTERPPPETQAILGESGHRWLTAFGPYSGNQGVLDVEITKGGVFDMTEPVPTQSPDGTIVLEFSGCNAGTVSYDIPSVNLQGDVPIQRIALDNVPICEEFMGSE